MYCVKCDHNLSRCTCADRDERLESLKTVPNFAFRECLICGKHYAGCKCEKPQWHTRVN